MALKRMDNMRIVVDDLPGAIAFFRELGLELEGRWLSLGVKQGPPTCDSSSLLGIRSVRWQHEVS